jgi:hypothetical protein
MQVPARSRSLARGAGPRGVASLDRAGDSPRDWRGSRGPASWRLVARWIAIAAAMLLTGMLAAASAASGTRAETREYKGAILSGRGAYASAGGAVAVTLVETQASPGPANPFLREGPPYTVSVKLGGALCMRRRPHSARRTCRQLSGALKGSAIQMRHIPDTPAVVKITAASGRTNILGVVTTKGTYAGTGFIARGVRSIRITLTGRSGAITIEGHGPPVKGFSPP